MKKLALLALLLFATPAWAGPFVICDPYPPGAVPTKFQVTYDGVTTEVPYIEAVFDGETKAVLKDLAGIPMGAHAVTAKACDIWGCTDDSVPLEFTKELLSVPFGLGLED